MPFLKNALVFLGSALAAFSLVAQAQGNEGLVADYTFDEGPGAVVQDHSGRGNNGKVMGAPEWVKTGKGFALKLHGNNDFVDCGNGASLNVAREGALQAWLKPAAFQGGALSWHLGGGWQDERLVLAWYGGTGLMCALSDGNYVDRGGWPPSPLNQWMHVALTWDGAAVRLYSNGLLTEEFAQDDPLDFGGAPLRIGRSEGLGAPYYAGLIGHVRIYNRALSPAEIFESFSNEAPDKGLPTPPGTKQLKLRMRSMLEGAQEIVLTADVSELRPIRAGMALQIEIPGTDLRKSLPLDPRLWRYEARLDAAGLQPGEHSLKAVVTDEKGSVAGAAALGFAWHKLLTRPAPSADEAAADAFVLVRDGQTATIMVPDKPDKWTQQAAEWLAQYVKESTGAALQVAPESASPKGNIISVGQTELLKKAGLTTEGLRYDGCRMAVRDNALFLFGRDELQFDRQGAKGTCKAVVTFLEDCVGVRWYLPGEEGAVVPRRRNLTVPRKLDSTFNPEFAYSNGRHLYGDGTPAGYANNFRTALKVLSYGGHSYYSWLPAGKYFKEHPEYFALIGGKRTGEGNHLCSSNPAVAQILLGEIRKQFDAGYDWVALGQEDGYARCECEACERLDNFRGTASPETPCERLLLLHKWIADECRKSHPNKTVHLLVYGPAVWPSRKFDSWGDNVAAEICSWDPDIIADWKGKVRAMTGYIYWFDTTLHRNMGIHATPAEVAEKIRFLHEAGFVGLYQVPETNWGLQGPSYYVLGKLMGEPYLDYRALQQEYCLGLFGEEAGATMNEFFNVLYSMPQVHAMTWPEEDVRRLDALLRKAEGQAKAPREAAWVKLTRDHFDYTRLAGRMLAAYRAWRQTPSDAGWTALRDAVNEFDAYRMRILNLPDDYTARFFPGYDEFCRFLASKYVGYYESWKAKRAEVLKKGIRGTPVGWGIAGGIFVGPLTMDFDKPPALTQQK